MRSTFGVLANGWPVQPSSSQRRSSNRMKTILGRSAAGVRIALVKAAAPRVIHCRLLGDCGFGLLFTVRVSNTYHTIRARVGPPCNAGCLTVFGNLFILDADRLIVAIGTAGETACPTLLDRSFGEVGGAGGFACRWKLISIAIQSRKRLCTL